MLTKSGKAGENIIDGLGPHEGLWCFIVDSEVFTDGLLQFDGVAMSASRDLLFAEQTEPVLNHVQPRG